MSRDTVPLASVSQRGEVQDEEMMMDEGQKSFEMSEVLNHER